MMPTQFLKPGTKVDTIAGVGHVVETNTDPWGPTVIIVENIKYDLWANEIYRTIPKRYNDR